MELVQTLSLIAATFTTGLMAGLFTSFAYAVMPALAARGRPLDPVRRWCEDHPSCRHLVAVGQLRSPHDVLT